MVKLGIIPVPLPLKIIPWAISHSRKILSNDNISTGLGEMLYSSYVVVLLNPERSLILSSGTKVITGPSVDISIIDPSVENFGLIVNR